MLEIASDLRLAARSLRRTPTFSIVAILTLAVGIGATTAMFAVAKRVVLEPLPYPSADRLVRLKNQVPGIGSGEEWNMSAAQYFHLRAESALIETVGAYAAGEVTLLTDADPQRVTAALVSRETLELIGARAQLGRSFTVADDSPGAPPVAVISDAFWRGEFGTDPGILGRTVDLLGAEVEVVGVLEPGAELPPEPGAPRADATDVWLPLAAIDERFDPGGPFYSNHTTPMFARLAPGVTPERLQSELDVLTAGLPAAYPGAYSQQFFERYGFRTVAYPLKQYVLGGVAASVWILLGAVALVLLIACANVSNLLLVRVEGRRRELAVRMALGAGRGALARRFLAEGLVLAVAGGGLGLILAVLFTRTLIAIAPDNFPRLADLGVDGGVAVFAAALSFAAAVLVAAIPSGRATSTGGAVVVASGRRGSAEGPERQPARGALVVAEVAIALVVAVGAGLLIESSRRLADLDSGIDPTGAFTFELFLGERYPDTGSMWRFYDAVLEQVRELPGVVAAGMSQNLPLTDTFACTVQGFEERSVYRRLEAADLTTCAAQQPTTPGYFDAVGIPLLQGRTFIDRDNDAPETGAVVVSRAFAERFWPDEDPIGKGVGPSGTTDQRFYRVVGVVGDVHNTSPTESPAAVVYYPIVRMPETQGWWPNPMRVVVRTELEDPLSIVPRIRDIVASLDPTVPVANAREMRVLVERSMARVTFPMTLVVTAAIMALVLAAVGLYGVISYVVTRRTGEIGVRLALGARSAEVRRLVLGGSMRLVSVGLILGAGTAFALTRVLQGMLYGVEPTHPAAYLAAAAALLGVAGIAGYLPARRATKLDPAVALRME